MKGEVARVRESIAELTSAVAFPQTMSFLLSERDCTQRGRSYLITLVLPLSTPLFPTPPLVILFLAPSE